MAQHIMKFSNAMAKLARLAEGTVDRDGSAQIEKVCAGRLRLILKDQDGDICEVFELRYC